MRVFAYVYFPRLKITGAERVPRDGGVIFVSNHLDYLDPVILIGVIPRRAVFLAMQKLFDWPVIGNFARMIGALPVRDEGSSLELARTTLQHLRDGEAIVVFPEGELSAEHALQPASSGAAMLAYRSGCPIVPIAITGTERVSWPSLFARPLLGPKITVRFGEPFRLAAAERVSAAVLKQGTDEIMRHVAALLPPEYRGVYGDARGQQQLAPLRRSS
jgi:1-acyl-sn-glycerol-3-phosphate acyltransferase